ncbi:MAG: DUF2975 domain-containing protein [Bacteroidota bacterium]
MSNLLLLVNNLALAIFGLVAGYLVVMGLVALFGLMPESMNATFELPVKLQNMEAFYEVTDHDNQVTSTHFEVKKANLEVLPSNRTWTQAICYFHGVLYLGFFIGILCCFGRILKAFNNGLPFEKVNSRLLTWIGVLTIGLAVYQFLIHVLVGAVFAGKFTISNAVVQSIPSLLEIDLVAIFLGLIFMAFASAFKKGADLEEFEALTV